MLCLARHVRIAGASSHVKGSVNTWLSSAFGDACLASVQDMHSCGSVVVQHCADPVSTTNTVLPTVAALEVLAVGRSGPDSGFAGQQLDGGAAHDDGAGGAAAPGVKQVGLPNMQSKQ